MRGYILVTYILFAESLHVIDKLLRVSFFRTHGVAIRCLWPTCNYSEWLAQHEIKLLK